jgi:hypothetical protein
MIRNDGEQSGQMEGASAKYNSVLGGTLLGRITASYKYRPVGKAPLSAGASATNTLTLGAAGVATLFDGDVVSVNSVDGLNGTAVMDDLDGVGSSGESIDLKSALLDGLAHSVTLTDPAGASSPLYTQADIDPVTGVYTVEVFLETDGGSAIVSTLDEVIYELNNQVGEAVQAALASGATGSTVIVAGALDTWALAGGVVPGGAIASTRTVSNKTSTTIDISGGAITALTGDLVQTEDGSDTAVGILPEGVRPLPTYNPTGDAVHEDVPCTVMIRGVAETTYLTGYNTATAADLRDDIAFITHP